MIMKSPNGLPLNKSRKNTCLLWSCIWGVPHCVVPGEDFLVRLLTRLRGFRGRENSRHKPGHYPMTWLSSKGCPLFGNPDQWYGLFLMLKQISDHWTQQWKSPVSRVKYLAYGEADQIAGWSQLSPEEDSNAENRWTCLQWPAKPILNKRS